MLLFVTLTVTHVAAFISILVNGRLRPRVFVFKDLEVVIRTPSRCVPIFETRNKRHSLLYAPRNSNPTRDFNSALAHLQLALFRSFASYYLDCGCLILFMSSALCAEGQHSSIKRSH